MADEVEDRIADLDYEMSPEGLLDAINDLRGQLPSADLENRIEAIMTEQKLMWRSIQRLQAALDDAHIVRE